MTNHPHRGWRARWTVDRAAQEARHGPSGLVVRFQRAGAPGAWDGRPTNGQAVFEALRDAHGPQDAARMLARLLREAGDIFSERHDSTHSR